MPNNLIELSDDFPVVQVKKWRITAAFLQDATVPGKLVDVNFLSGVRESEADLTARDLIGQNLDSKAVENTDVGISIDKLLGRDTNAVVYLYCELTSKTAQDVHILFTGIQESKIWMNNRFVYKSRWRNSQSKHYQEYVPVKLEKGKNLLLVKVALSDRITAGIRWNFNMCVANRQYAQESFLKDYRFTILDEPVTKDSVRLYLGPFVNEDLSVQVKDIVSGSDAIPWMISTKGNDREIRSGLRAIPLEGMERERLYSIAVRMGKDTLRQDFMFGDYAKVVAGLKCKYREAKEAYGFEPNEDFTTAYERLDYLDTKPNLSASQVSEKSHWDLSRVLFAKEVWRHLDGYERSGGEHFSGIISGYVSAIDSSRQYYLSHIPEHLLKKGGKIPLIFIMPFTYSHAKLLETWGISNLDQMWWDAKLAEDNGFGLVWADLRGHPGTNEISVTAFREILASLNSRFEPDGDRLFVLGNSASSIKAMSLATKLPSVFAGVLFVNPEIGSLRSSRTYANIENLTNQRVFIQHSSKDEIIPVHQVEDFHRALKNNGIDAHFIKVDNSTHFVAPKDNYRQLFSLLKNFRKKDSNHRALISGSELKYADNNSFRVMERLGEGRFKLEVACRNDTVVIEQHNVKRFEIDFSQLGYPASLPHIRLNGGSFGLKKKDGNANVFEFDMGIGPRFRKNSLTEGPVNHVFAGAFKVVYNDSGKNIKDMLDDQWKNIYFLPIPSVEEKAFCKDTYESSHLVVIGSKWKNAYLRQMLDGLPIKLEQDSLVFRGKRYGRKNLMLGFVYPNPLNPNKYVYFIDTDKAVRELFHRDFTNECTHDYELYNTTQDVPVPIEIGSFDNLWK